MLWLAVWRREKKQSMEQLVVAPSTGAHQLLRRGAGDASDGALHIANGMVCTRIVS